MNFSRTLLLFGSAAALAAPAAADEITGRVVDSNGVGVFGVNIDVDNLGGGDDPIVMNGGTDPNGFFTATLPAGFYDVIFTPPAPPTTTHLIHTVPEIVVVNTTDMGTIALPAGVAVSGRVLGPGGTPVENVDLDVVDEVTGDALDLQGDNTDAQGEFLIAVPPNAITLEFETDNVAGPLLAPEALELSLSADTDVGDVNLQDGFLVSLIVEDNVGSPVQGADIDAVDTVTGVERFTPRDNTDGSGFVDFVVPAGTYDIEVCPQFADRLVADALRSVAISSTTNLGTMSLQPGVVLSGNVTEQGGGPLAGVDLDVRFQSSGVAVVLCGDNTDASGNYAIVVPTGTFDVTFTPPPSLPLSPLTTSVVVSGDTTLDAELSMGDTIGTRICSPAVPNSTGMSGLMTVLGSSTVADDDLQLFATQLPTNPNIGYFIMGTGTNTFVPPGSSGPICVAPGIKRYLPPVNMTTQLDGGFSRDVGTSGPVSGQITPGSTWSFQAWHRDSMASTSNLTDAITITFQ